MSARYEYMKAYREKNREKFRGYMREWYKNNPEKRREYVNRYWKKQDDLKKGVYEMQSIKNKYIETTRKACKIYYDAVKRCTEVEESREKTAPIQWNIDVQNARKQKDEALYQADTMIKECHDTCAGIIKDFYSIKPENMNSDIVAILNTGVILKPADIEKLLSDCSDNAIMVRIISEYADSHNISFSGVVITEQKQLEKLNRLDKFAHSGLRAEWYYNTIIKNDSEINKVIAPICPQSTVYVPVEF